MTNNPYPVRVEGRLDPGLSRWMWLVKWLLLIPHLVVLAFLGLAFWVLTIVALVAILSTGRYPRAIFGFNLGVLRWAWRVAYYGYAANGTDRYPPFTLADVPDYPARLDVDYPEHLSRGLALVKWWVHALPHYLVLAFFVGAGGSIVWRIGTTGPVGFDGGLVSVLVLIGAVALLFTGRYPRGVFDAVLGMDRWVLRVVAYAALMTDAYPPFRLDQGGTEPAPLMPDGPSGRPGEAAAEPKAGTFVGAAAGSAAAGSAAPAGPATAVLDRPAVRDDLRRPRPEPQPRTPVGPPSPGRSVLLAAGAAVSALALAIGGAGVTGLMADTGGRDAAGFVQSGIGHASTTGFALRTTPIRIDSPAGSAWPAQVLGDVRLTARADDGRDVFIGIAHSADAAAYLDGVAQGVWRAGPGANPGLETRTGGAPVTVPAAQRIWVASATGPGEQSLTWTPTGGDWTAVVMNADGSAPLAADVRAGLEAPSLRTASGVAAGTGLGLLVIGLVLIVLGARPRRVPGGDGR
ncbi:MAG: hypothetical protein QOJ30_1510 [Pseudonocardiales bacterium]|jgi:hypothetical protein|nr:hypothetical protein [Pseudonocardiales bacterium]